MSATQSVKPSPARKERSNEPRERGPRSLPIVPSVPLPAAGAHAAAHLINEDATPGAGVLPSRQRYGKEVDGAAG